MDTPEARRGAEPSTSTRKKSAASLLPAFEPLSSSPALPKALKRSRSAFEERQPLPTPLPTSSTLIPSSSPTRRNVARNLFKRTERKPLGAVPSVVVKNDGTSTKLGRSSQSCDHQLSANRLISRVHVEVTYIPEAGRLTRERLEIACTGWNGVKIHCQSKVYELKRGAVFSSDIREAEILLDVHDSRVILQWPEKPHLGAHSSDEEDFASSPTKRQQRSRRHSTPPSPSPAHTRPNRILPPLSPSPASHIALPSSPPAPAFTDAPAVEIFVDPETAELVDHADSEATTKKLNSSGPSSSDPSARDFSDNDEENDPIIHSFGPYGANLLPRMAAVQAGSSPIRASLFKTPRLPHSEPVKAASSPIKQHVRDSDVDGDVQRHIINQLAYSRLSSLPLSTIVGQLPAEKQDITTAELRRIIHETACIGEITREGKDAAGKPLENEFYYVPDRDDDVHRKQAAVDDLRKPGMRACRKQHKVSTHEVDLEWS